jgi:hypothetical protein
LGTRGSVGVIGIAFGGLFGGRRADCFASASSTYSFETIGGWAVVVACLNGLARITILLALGRLPQAASPSQS